MVKANKCLTIKKIILILGLIHTSCIVSASSGNVNLEGDQSISDNTLQNSTAPAIPAAGIIDNTSSAQEIKNNTADSGKKFVHIYDCDEDHVKEQCMLYAKYFLPEKIKSKEEHTEADSIEIIKNFKNMPSGVESTKRQNPIIISLTSYPARFATTWLAIESLLRQSVRPDYIVLNLFEGEFERQVLPILIKMQMKRGVVINWNKENWKVYLKVLPTMYKFPQAIVVAADDDLIYPSDFLGNLIDGHKKHPDCVIAGDVRVMNYYKDSAQNKSYITPVNTWNFTGQKKESEEFQEPRSDIIPEGVFGILYPPYSVKAEAFKKEKFLSLCPTDDDLWMYAMIVLNGKKVFKINRGSSPRTNIDGTQEIETALWRKNFANRSEILTKYFIDIYNTYNLKKILGDYECAASINGIKASLGFSNLTFDQSFPFNRLDKDFKLPMDLVSGFGDYEDGGIWTIGKSAKIRVYKPAMNTFAKVVIEGTPFIDPSIGSSQVTVSPVEGDLTPKTREIYKNSAKRKLTFLHEFTKTYEIFELATPNAVVPAKIGICNDFRELGFYTTTAKVSSIMAKTGKIQLGNDMADEEPLNMDIGFYGPEPSGVWSADVCVFSVLLQEIGTAYNLKINGRLYNPKNDQNISVRVMDQYGQQIILDDSDKKKFISFNYTPKSNISRFILRVDNATSPKKEGASNDERVLGFFFNSIEINKK